MVNSLTKVASLRRASTRFPFFDQLALLFALSLLAACDADRAAAQLPCLHADATRVKLRQNYLRALRNQPRGSVLRRASDFSCCTLQTSQPALRPPQSGKRPSRVCHDALRPLAVWAKDARVAHATIISEPEPLATKPASRKPIKRWCCNIEVLITTEMSASVERSRTPRMPTDVERSAANLPARSALDVSLCCKVGIAKKWRHETGGEDRSDPRRF